MKSRTPTSAATITNIAGAERAAAARLLEACLKPPNRSIDRLLSEAQATPALRAMVFGVLRSYFRVSNVVDQRLRRPLSEKNLVIRYLLLTGAYQLLFGGVSPHAAVNETVAACERLNRPGLKGLVNAILRDIDRNRIAILEEAERSFELPGWLFSEVQSGWRNRATAIARSFQEQPKMCLRVNTSKVNADVYRVQLQEKGFAFSDGWLKETLFLDTPIRQEDLPGFSSGLVSVQDAGAQFAASILDVNDTHRVLDACAAPGGKLFHLLERSTPSRMVAVEWSASRAEHLSREGLRLGHANRFTLEVADARHESWWDQEAFDRILLDAPCTGVGTIRRRPDIRLHRSPRDVDLSSALQLDLLKSLWMKLAPGGQLLYVTCSILPAENDRIIEAFLHGHPDAHRIDIHLPTGIATSHGWQLLPDDPLTDGFFYSLLQRV